MVASRSKGRPARITAGLVWFHRWLGIATCLIFALWFASGAVLLFKPFPSLSQTDQLAMQAEIDAASVAVSPARALSAAGMQASSLRLVQRGGAPAYLVEGGDRTVAVDARSGKVLPLLSADAVGARTAAVDYDQWIVHNHFDPYRPIYRRSQADAVVYVSAVTGETVQRTTMSDRAWNWVGAVLHWAYFTPLRSSFTAWDRTVWIMSFISMLVAIAGIILGVMRTMVAMRQRKPSLSFFRLKWLRWHHILGLFSSVFVLSWIMSGWLSMDHGRLFSRGQPTQAQQNMYGGQSMSAALESIDASVIRRLSPTKRIDFTVSGGAPILNSHGADGRVVRFDSAARRLSDRDMEDRIVTGVRAAWPGSQVEAISRVDTSSLYALAEGWGPSVLRVHLVGGAFPDVYVDGENGKLITIMDNSRAAYAWIYYALHTFNFPGLTTRPLLRQMLILIPLTLGFIFSLTGIVIGWQRLRKSF